MWGKETRTNENRRIFNQVCFSFIIFSPRHSEPQSNFLVYRPRRLRGTGLWGREWNKTYPVHPYQQGFFAYFRATRHSRHSTLLANISLWQRKPIKYFYLQQAELEVLIFQLLFAVVSPVPAGNRGSYLFVSMPMSVRSRVRKSISKSVKGSACKFRFTVTYEYVDLKCNNRW